jgi:hypothetical protein
MSFRGRVGDAKGQGHGVGRAQDVSRFFRAGVEETVEVSTFSCSRGPTLVFG